MNKRNLDCTKDIIMKNTIVTSKNTIVIHKTIINSKVESEVQSYMYFGIAMYVSIVTIERTLMYCLYCLIMVQ